MTTEKMISSLKAKGWDLSFEDSEYLHVAKRGIAVFKNKSVTNLYKVIKLAFNFN